MLTDREIWNALRAKGLKPCPSKGGKKKRKKKLRPGRLDAAGMKALREERYEKDQGKCVDCGVPRPLLGDIFTRMHLAHVLGRGAGGEDTIENTRSKCYGCHIVKDHNAGGKPCPAKPTEQEFDSMLGL